jgi:hypothetical protein
MYGTASGVTSEATVDLWHEEEAGKPAHHLLLYMMLAMSGAPRPPVKGPLTPYCPNIQLQAARIQRSALKNHALDFAEAATAAQ